MNSSKIKDAYSTGVAISEMSDENRRQLIKKVMTYGVFMRAQNLQGDATIDTVVNGINEFLTEDYPNLRDKELDYIVRLGISGELGQETFVCGASLMRWVRIYCKSAERLAQVEQSYAEKTNEEEIDYAAANERACNESIHQLFEYYQRNNTVFGEEKNEQGEVVAKGASLPQWVSQVYIFFRQNGKIPTPNNVELEVANTRAMHSHSVKGINVFGKSVKAELTDWISAYLLEQYFANVLKRPLTI